MIVYFTGTGNSRYVAQALSAQLGDALVDAAAFVRSDKALILTSEQPWVFVSPTYAWRVPRIFSELLEKGQFRGSRTAYFILTCGDGIGAAGRRLPALCRRMALECRGVRAVVMPENYVAMFPVPNDQEAETIRQRAWPAIQAAAEDIRAGRAFPPCGRGPLNWACTEVVNPLFYRFCVTARPFHVTDACISCGKCEAVCMLHNVALAEGKPRWGRRCTHCMACICSCPTQAIEYGKKSRGKPRYLCPSYLQLPEENI